MTVPVVFKNARLWMKLFETAKAVDGNDTGRDYFHEFVVDGLSYRLDFNLFYLNSWKNLKLYVSLGGETIETIYWNFSYDERSKRERKNAGNPGSLSSRYNNTKYATKQLPHFSDPAVRAEIEHVILILALTMEGETV